MTDNISRKSIVAPYIEGVINEKHSLGYSYESEELVLNSKGESVISYADYAIAMVDEIESGKHIKERISVVSE